MTDDLQPLIDFDLITVRSETERPVRVGPTLTLRSHDCNSVENGTLLDRIDAVKIKADQLQALFDTETVHEVSDNLFNEDYPVIEDIETLKKLLSEVNIRFDNSPRNYKKEDYFSLLRVINQSLLFLYGQVESDLATKEYVDEKITEAVEALQVTIDDLALQIQDLEVSKQDVITDLETIRTGAALGATAVLTEQDPVFLLSPAGSITEADLNKWNTPQAQSDWDQTSTSAVDYIKNKPENLSDFNDDLNYLESDELLGELGYSQIQACIPVIDKSSDTAESFLIKPNYKYNFGTREVLDIRLESAELTTILNEYMFEFTSGDTPTRLTLPSDIKWVSVPDIQANKIYQCSIENKLGIIGEW